MMTNLFRESPFKRTPARLALVIGNSAYVQVKPLPNAAKDAALIADRLRSLGIDVHHHEDLDKAGMDLAVQAFADRLKKIGSVDTVIFYFSGHGYQEGGTNYLLPIILGDDQTDSVNLQNVIDTLSKLSRRRLIFLMPAAAISKQSRSSMG